MIKYEKKSLCACGQLTHAAQQPATCPQGAQSGCCLSNIMGERPRGQRVCGKEGQNKNIKKK
jgi:hypothetical protein